MIPREKIVLFGGKFEPPGKHHRIIAEALLASGVFTKEIIIPCGGRPDKAGQSSVSSEHRKQMVEFNFSGIKRVSFDWSDIGNELYLPTRFLDQRYKASHAGYEIWHAVGGDLISGGKIGQSEIQRQWYDGPKVWQELNFAVINEPNSPVAEEDLPPHSIVIPCPKLTGRSSVIRRRIKDSQPVAGLLMPAVLDYIVEHQLYRD